MNPNLNHHQWKIVFDAVRKQQVVHLPDSKWYGEYTEILNEIFDLAYSESYLDTNPPPYKRLAGWEETTKEDWDDFWNGPTEGVLE